MNTNRLYTLRAVGLLLTCWAIAYTATWAQQTAGFSLHRFNPYSVQPAAAGLDSSLNVIADFRKQWTGLPGSPTTIGIAADVPWYWGGGGLGLKLQRDELGLEQTTTAQATYAYHSTLRTSVQGNTVLSFALGAGFLQKSIDGTQFRTANPTLVDAHVPTTSTVQASAPILHAGVYLKTPRFEAGLGAEQTAFSALRYSAADAFAATNIQLLRTLTLTALYRVPMGETWTFEPNLLAKTDGIQLQTDLGATFYIQGLGFFGGAVRGYNSASLDAATVYVGAPLTRNITVVYGYDIGLSPLNTVHSGSHEVVLKYDLHKKVGGPIDMPIIYNPRYY